MNTPRPSDGFSMIELLIVLSLIGIMASIAAPSLQGYLDRHRTERALDQIAADLAFTRLLAVRQGRPATLAFTGSGYRIQVTRANGTEETYKVVPLLQSYPGVALQADADVSFTSRGLLRSPAGAPFIRVTNPRFRDSVQVSPVGRVYRAY